MALSTLGLLTVGAIPTVIGVAEAIDAQKKQNAQAKERIKFHLTATFSHDGVSPPQTAYVVFKDNKVLILKGGPIHSASHINALEALFRSPSKPRKWLPFQRLLFRLPVSRRTSRSSLPH